MNQHQNKRDYERVRPICCRLQDCGWLLSTSSMMASMAIVVPCLLLRLRFIWLEMDDRKEAVESRRSKGQQLLFLRRSSCFVVLCIAVGATVRPAQPMTIDSGTRLVRKEERIRKDAKEALVLVFLNSICAHFSFVAWAVTLQRICVLFHKVRCFYGRGNS